MRGAYTALATVHMLKLDKVKLAEQAGVVQYVCRCQVSSHSLLTAMYRMALVDIFPYHPFAATICNYRGCVAKSRLCISCTQAITAQQQAFWIVHYWQQSMWDILQVTVYPT